MAGTDLPGSTSSRSRCPTPAAWCCCPSSTASAPRRCPTRPACCTASPARNATPAHLVRAAVDGLLCGLADAVEAVQETGVDLRRIVLIGGAARSRRRRHAGRAPCSASRCSAPSRGSTSPSVPPARPPGRCPAPTPRPQWEVSGTALAARPSSRRASAATRRGLPPRPRRRPPAARQARRRRRPDGGVLTDLRHVIAPLHLYDGSSGTYLPVKGFHHHGFSQLDSHSASTRAPTPRRSRPSTSRSPTASSWSSSGPPDAASRPRCGCSRDSRRSPPAGSRSVTRTSPTWPPRTATSRWCSRTTRSTRT